MKYAAVDFRNMRYTLKNINTPKLDISLSCDYVIYFLVI